MNWEALGRSGKLTVAALVGAAAAHSWAVLAREGELPLFAIVLELVLVGLAMMAATGRWQLTALSAVLSGSVGVVSAFGAMDASPPLEGAAAVAVYIFVSLALGAGVSGSLASRQSRRERARGK